MAVTTTTNQGEEMAKKRETQYFNGHSFDNIRKDLDAALKEVGDKYGMAFSMGAIRYDDLSFHGKLTASKLNDDGKRSESPQIMKWRQGLERSGYRWGVRLEVGDKFMDLSTKTEFIIVGMRPRAKHKVVAHPAIGWKKGDTYTVIHHTNVGNKI
jgi:hypothetical protein